MFISNSLLYLVPLQTMAEQINRGVMTGLDIRQIDPPTPYPGRDPPAI